MPKVATATAVANNEVFISPFPFLRLFELIALDIILGVTPNLAAESLVHGMASSYDATQIFETSFQRQPQNGQKSGNFSKNYSQNTDNFFSVF
ncbi:hypothetical protein GCM10011369_31440 [Neiella marina]|uniref:Uncharacterized protein n=1 Tax=Neiella marina TaxID=508461 RepID=A0A8J2XR07_9GAMM|nr:hypothetical protein GCM10011369_31440 [Neiella marina]